jgi:hypothetical protein
MNREIEFDIEKLMENILTFSLLLPALVMKTGTFLPETG